MQPIRQIIEDAPATIPVPVDMRHRRVEIIFWPLDEPSTSKEATGWPAGFFETTAGCLADDPIARAPQGGYEQRLELK